MIELGPLLLGIFTWAVTIGSLIAIVQLRRRKRAVPWPTVALVAASLGFLSLSSAIGVTVLILTGEPSGPEVLFAITLLRVVATAIIVGFILRFAAPHRFTAGIERFLLPLT